MVTIRVYTSASAGEGGNLVDLDQLEQMVRGLRNAWIDMMFDVVGSEGPAAEEMFSEERNFLLETMGFHPLAVEDCFVEQVSRAERFENHRFVVMRARELDESELDTEFLRVFLTDDVVVTVRHSPMPAVEAFGGRYRSARLAKQLDRGPEFLLYELLDAVTDDWAVILDGYSNELDDIEYKVFDPSRKYPDLLEDLHVLKQNLREVSKSLVPLHEIISQMLKSDDDFLSDENLIYYQDMADNIKGQVDAVANYSAGATSTRDSYLSHVSMRLAESNARLSEVITTLTVIGAIMLPLTLIAGIFGMNVDALSGGRSSIDLMHILSVMAIFAMLMLYYFYRKGWLTRRD